MTEREKFEEWVRSEYPGGRRFTSFTIKQNGRYLDGTLNDWWKVWQARASLDVLQTQTETLEKQNVELAEAVKLLTGKYVEVANQRDDLLATLESSLPALVECERAYRKIGAVVGQGEFARKLAKAREVIASVKGKV